jgi:hypothetical protein
MNRILTLVGVKWKKIAGKKDEIGDPLKPLSHLKMIRDLLCKLRERNIDYDVNELSDIGEFSGVLATIWQGRQQVDAGYAVEKKKRVDPKYMRLLTEAIQKKTFQPMTNPKHMLYALIFCNGYYAAFRGGQDHYLLNQNDITEGVFDADHGDEWNGRPYISVRITASKATRLSVRHPSVKKKTRTELLIPSEANIPGFDPPAIFKKYKSMVHPDAKKFYCRIIESEATRVKFNNELKQRDIDWNRANPSEPRVIKDYDVYFYPSGLGVTNHNIGSNQITKYCKEMAQLIGIKDFEACTGHALRALNQTNGQEGGLNTNDIANMARQSSLHVQSVYIDGMTSERERKQLNAISMSNVVARTSAGRALLSKPTKSKQAPVLPAKRPAPSDDHGEEVSTKETDAERLYRLRAEAAELELKLLRSNQKKKREIVITAHRMGPYESPIQSHRP